MLLTPSAYLTQLRASFKTVAKPAIAKQQANYMRNQFEFYGIKTPERKALLRAIFKDLGCFDGADLKTFARGCFEAPYRELHYAALDMIEKRIKYQEQQFIDFLEELALTNSWWDTVDWINKLVGLHFKQFPELILPTTEKWMASDNIWLQRICLIFQLPYKDQTDEVLLFKYILQLAHSEEFFIQKAAGWALRQYSRQQPKRVKSFIKDYPLSPLTKREGSKYL